MKVAGVLVKRRPLAKTMPGAPPDPMATAGHGSGEKNMEKAYEKEITWKAHHRVPSGNLT